MDLARDWRRPSARSRWRARRLCESNWSHRCAGPDLPAPIRSACFLRRSTASSRPLGARLHRTPRTSNEVRNFLDVARGTALSRHRARAPKRQRLERCRARGLRHDKGERTALIWGRILPPRPTSLIAVPTTPVAAGKPSSSYGVALGQVVCSSFAPVPGVGTPEPTGSPQTAALSSGCWGDVGAQAATFRPWPVRATTAGP